MQLASFNYKDNVYVHHYPNITILSHIYIGLYKMEKEKTDVKVWVLIVNN